MRELRLEQVVSKAVVVATGITAIGGRELLGLAVGDSEEVTFWWNLAVIESAPHGLLMAGYWKVDWKVLPCWCGPRPVTVDAVRGGAVHLRVELLRTVDGRLEGVVTTESGSQQSFSGTLDLLRILEELEPPADRSLDQVPPR